MVLDGLVLGLESSATGLFFVSMYLVWSKDMGIKLEQHAMVENTFSLIQSWSLYYRVVTLLSFALSASSIVVSIAKIQEIRHALQINTTRRTHALRFSELSAKYTDSTFSSSC